MPQRLVEALGLDDTNQFRLSMAEALGNIALAVHYIRSLLTWLHSINAFGGLLPEARATFGHTLELISEIEKSLWEIAPSRAALLEMRKFRLTGELDPDFKALFAKDGRGRIPETPDAIVQPLLFEEVLKRLADYKVYTANGKPPTVPD